MDIRTVLRLLRERWAWIAILTVLGAGLAGVLVTRATPVYSAQATLYVSARADASNPALAYQGSLLSQQQVTSYAQLIATQRVLTDVARALGAGVTAEELVGRVSAEVVPDTSLLVVRATDTSPGGARDTANAVAQHFVAVLPELEGTTDDAAPAVVVTVVNPAELPLAPVSPRPVRSVGIGALLGLLAGLALAVVRQSLDQSVTSAEQAQDVAGVPALGSIPHDPGAARQPLAVGEQAHRGRGEALRKVAASLRFLDVERPHSVLMITSPSARDGKSTTACNLALTLAREGRRVIIVDGDLRRPQVSGYLGLPAGAGLTSVLVGSASLAEATQVWGEEQLAVLACGPLPPNPSELLGSQRMRDLLTHLRGFYDVVLLDVPPVLPVADATVAAAGCDGVILVARHGRTRRDQLHQAARTLAATPTPVLGVILNRTPARGGADLYYYERHAPDPDRPAPAHPSDPAPAAVGR